MMNEQLSQNFSLAEMTISETASRQGIDNWPDVVTLQNLRRLASSLERVRQLFGRPLLVSSGYRSPAAERGDRR